MFSLQLHTLQVHVPVVSKALVLSCLLRELPRHLCLLNDCVFAGGGVLRVWYKQRC